MIDFNEAKVSVLIPCYNSEKTIARAIHSILNGTFLPHEILIYDDASTDKTLEKVHEISSKHSIIKVKSGLTNEGAGVSRNRLLSFAKGNIIAFLDADDEWFSDKLEVQLLAMQKTGAKICTCGYEIRDQNGNRISQRQSGEYLTLPNFFWGNPVPTSMTVLDASLKGALNMPNLRKRQDYAYWIHLLKNNNKAFIYSVQGIHGAYHKTPDSLSANVFDNVRHNFIMHRREFRHSILTSVVLTLMNILNKIAKTF